MPEPVKIVLMAETEQAVTALRDFLNTANPGLKQLAIGAKETTGALTNNRLAMMELGHVGRAMAEGLAAGISPLRMLAMETPRLAQAASMSGIGLNSIKTAIAGINPLALGAAAGLAAVAGVGALVWTQINADEQKAIETHNQFVQALQQMPVVIGHINDAAKAGFLSPETQAKLLTSIGATRAELSKLDFLHQVMTPQSGPANTGARAFQDTTKSLKLFGLPDPRDLKSANDELVRAGFLLKEIGKDGKETFSVSDKGEAIIKIIDLRQKLTLAALSGYDKERAAAKQSYDEQLADLNEYLERANDKLKAGEADRLRGGLKDVFKQQISDIDFREREENQKKADAAFVEGQRQFAQTVAQENKKLEEDLNLSAAQQGKTRQQIYQEEYNKRIDLLTGEFIQGLISEKQYTQAVQDATTARLNGLRAETEERRRLYALEMQMAQHQAEQKMNSVLSDPKATGSQKLAAISDTLETTREMAKQNALNLQGAKTDEERLQFTREEMLLNDKYTSLLQEQKKQEEQINQARVQSVQNMFLQMASAAKAFGKEGLAAYKAFAIASATIDTAKAAIAAYSSAADIPYVGWILAPIAAAAAVAAGAAQIQQIESVSAREHGGGIQSGVPYMVGERGRELIVPTESARVFNADDTSRLVNLSRTSSGGRDRGGNEPKVHLAAHIWGDQQKMEQYIRNNPNIHHTVVDIISRNAHLIPKQSFL